MKEAIGRSRLVVSADGSLAALATDTGVRVLELPSCAVSYEFEVMGLFEIAWLGTPPRLLVLSRHTEHSTALLRDGSHTLAEIELAAPVWLVAAVGSHALVIGTNGAAVITAQESHLTPYQFPARAKPTIAGAAGNQFVVAMPGVIEEWDPISRAPKRRLRLPRPAQITALGGSERVVWMVTQQAPDRIDVLPLINRSQPKLHDLPEPIVAVAGHPKTDLLACLCAEHRVYAIDLDGRTRLRSLAFSLDRIEAIALAAGRNPGVVGAQDGKVAFASLDPRDSQAQIVVPGAVAEETPAPSRAATPPPMPVPASTAVPSPLATRETRLDTGGPTRLDRIDTSPRMSALGAWTPAPPKQPSTIASKAAVPIKRSPTNPPVGVPEPVVPMSRTAKNLAQRFAAVRERREAAFGGAPATDERDVVAAIAPDSATWRDDCVAWARSELGASGDAMPPPLASPIEELASRFDLAVYLTPALVLIYGAHLAGHDGVAPVDVSRILHGRWEEALGRGELAAAKVVVHDRSRVRLARAVERALDELPPLVGTLIGVPSTNALLAPCVVVGDDPIAVAHRYAKRAGGAILVGDDRDAVLFEARAIGAAPLLPAHSFEGTAPVLYLARDDEEADRLGLSRL